MNKKFLNFPLEIKSLSESGLIKGYASVFGVIDLHNDILLPGAFSKTINNQNREDIKLLWQHRIDEPIGIIDHIYEDSYGLYIEAKLLLDVIRAQEAYSLILAKSVTGLSIGYYPVEYYWDSDENIRVITEVNLKEISLVTFPANKDAAITYHKSIDYDDLYKIINKAINILKQ